MDGHRIFLKIVSKEFWKSVHYSQSYYQKSDVLFFRHIVENTK